MGRYHFDITKAGRYNDTVYVCKQNVNDADLDELLGE